MGKSATVLGREFGRNGREMNELLFEHGYLYGNPGAYGLTEKGQGFGEEQHHSRGTGGYAHYNRNWETRTWSDETAAALKADIEASSEGIHEAVDPAPAEVHDDSAFEPGDYRYRQDDDPQIGWVGLAGIAGALILAPHARPFWDNKVKPAVDRLRDEKVKPAVSRLRDKRRSRA